MAVFSAAIMYFGVYVDLLGWVRLRRRWTRRRCATVSPRILEKTTLDRRFAPVKSAYICSLLVRMSYLGQRWSNGSYQKPVASLTKPLAFYYTRQQSLECTWKV